MKNFKSGSSKFLKNINQQHVLNLIRLKSGITVAEMNKKTGLRMSTLSYILKNLKEWNLIREKGLGLSTKKGGKKPVLWELSPNYGYLIGLSGHERRIRLSLLDFTGRVLFKESHEYNGENFVEFSADKVYDFMEDQSLDESMILGLGVSVPGVYDAGNGRLGGCPFWKEEECDFKGALQTRFSFPVDARGDATAGAFALKWFSGDNKKLPHLIYISLGAYRGYVAIGMIFNHELYTGDVGRAGTGMYYEEKRNAEENRVSVKEWRRGIFSRDNSFLTGIVERLDNLLNPSRIILGGEICEYDNEMKMFVERFNERRAGEKSLLFTAPFGEYTASVGAAAVIYRLFFKA